MKRKISALILAFTIIIGVFGISGVRVSAAEDYTPGLKVKKINDGTGVKVKISNAWDLFFSYQLYVTGGAYDGYESKTEPFIYLNTGNISKKKTLTYTINAMQPGTYYFCVKADSWSVGLVTSKTVKVKINKVDAEDKPIPSDNADLSSLKKGDSFFMGYYEQDGDMRNGREPIEWVVLSKTDTKALVISKYALDCLPYDTEGDADLTWETSTIRSWLNKIFYKNAFSKEEKALILKSKIKTPGSEYEAQGCVTKDRVFLLSYDEVTDTKLFTDNNSRKTSITDYCRERGGGEAGNPDENTMTLEGKPACYWSLRSTQGYAWENDYVNLWGELFTIGEHFVYYNGHIRPAMYINVK